MNISSDVITPLDFKRILFELWEHSPQTKIRLRVMGKMWDRNFLQVVHITGGDAIILHGSDHMKQVSINDIVQFELETKFQDFKPNNHYTVELS